MPVIADVIIIEGQSLGAVLMGALAASLLTWIGAWTLQRRGERLAKVARLRAIETELRSNKVIADQVLAGQQPYFELSDELWNRLRVELALDLGGKAYESLIHAFYGFERTRELFRRTVTEGQTQSDLAWLVSWRDNLEEAQVYVVGELNLHWKWKAQIERFKSRVRHGSKGPSMETVPAESKS